MSFLARSSTVFLRRTAAPLANTTSSLSVAAYYTTHAALPEEHRMVHEMCRKFADEELAPKAKEWDKKHEFPLDAVTKLVSYCCVYNCAYNCR